MIAIAMSENGTDLSAADIFYCDGTFYICPSMLHQIYSMYIMIDATMTLVVCAILLGEPDCLHQILHPTTRSHAKVKGDQTW